MRRFSIIRDQDVTGVSGTGLVAEGCQFSDGTCVVRWRPVAPEKARKGLAPTTVVHADIASVETLHGHNGATRVEWLDGETS